MRRTDRWFARTSFVSAVALGLFGFVGPAARADAGFKMQDDCDPASFNAAVGPGTCVGDGETTFQQFIAQLQDHQRADAWTFDPTSDHVNAGEPITVENEGGETHTFTKVAAFGGGFVAALNHLSGHPNPAPECATRNSDGSLSPRPPSGTNRFVGPGDETSLTTGAGGDAPSGTNMFQCCVHPWMEVVLNVQPGRRD